MKTGFWGLSRELDRMLENRIFADGTVDAVLQDKAVLLTAETVTGLYCAPCYDTYRFGVLQKQRPLLWGIAQAVTAGQVQEMEKVQAIAKYTAELETQFPIAHEPNQKFYSAPDEYFWGGPEELLITKGSDWCGEVARVFCALTQCARVPSRIVYTFSESDGHVMNECYVDEQWILVDATNNFIYTGGGRAYNASGMLLEKESFAAMLSGYSGYYSQSEFFRYVGIAGYILAEAASYSYKVSFCNDFYRARLKDVWNL